MKQSLSPSAQAIWDAWNDAYEAQGPLEDMGQPLGAALRAAADQVVPVDRGSRRQMNIRTQLLTLAAELEAQ